MPKVSVLMPVFNSEVYLSEAIDSILNQTFEDFEFIIIDDGSNDRSQEIVRSYSDPRIRFYVNKQNMGVAATLNRGLELATGEYIARMDSDDISLPNRFKEQVDFLNRHQSVGVIGSNIEVFGENLVTTTRNFPQNSQKLKAELLFSSCFAHPAVMIRRKCLIQYKLKYSPEYNGIEDYVLWWRMAEVTELGSVNRVLLRYRQHELQATKNHSVYHVERRKSFIEERLRVFSCEISQEEMKLVYCYSCGETASMTVEDVRGFINFIGKLKRCNRNTKYFSYHQLAKVLSSAVNDVVCTVNLSRKERKRLYRYGIQHGAMTVTDVLKLVLRNKVL